jgi:hypothetical protein
MVRMTDPDLLADSGYVVTYPLRGDFLDTIRKIASTLCANTPENASVKHANTYVRMGHLMSVKVTERDGDCDGGV